MKKEEVGEDLVKRRGDVVEIPRTATGGSVLAF